MKEEDFDCKFPELYSGKEHGREVGTQKKVGAGGSSAVAIFNGRGLACLWAKRHRCLGWPGWPGG
jgi:hypothetical protein